MARHKDTDWELMEAPTWEMAHIAVLMDIRDLLRGLNAHLGHTVPCLVGAVDRIDRNSRPKHKRKVKTKKRR
jgi:hypothetical protein